jgi:hypothetical protein
MCRDGALPHKLKEQALVFVDLCLMNVYRRRKLGGAGVVASHKMAANGVAIGCDRAIAGFSVA